MPKTATSAHQRGLALVVVLWAAILLALLAGGVTRLSRSDLNLSRNLAESTKAELAADRALWTAVYMIVNGGSDAWRIDGTVYAWRFGEAEVRVRVTDEHGRIDINAAAPEFLAVLFTAAGVEPAQAAALAEAVAEFRNQRIDSPVTAGFARPAAALGSPFALVEGLEQVPGMQPALVARIAPAITVYTGVSWPREESAPPLVLAAMEERVLEDDAEDRPAVAAANDPQNLADGPAVLSEVGSTATVEAELVHIEAEAATAGGSYFAREAVIALGTRDFPHYQLRLWRRGARVLFPAPAEFR